MTGETLTADILVVGGGMAGITAALAASRDGAQVLVAEGNGFLGGTATASMTGELNGYTHHRRTIHGGITAEVVARMIAAGFASLKYDVPMSGNPSIRVDRVRYDPERLKIFLDDLLVGCGVRILFHSSLISIAAGDEKAGYRATLAHGRQEMHVRAPILIDATGNADVARLAGMPTYVSGRESMQAMSLIFRMGSVDHAAFEAVSTEERQEAIRSGYEGGIMPAKYCGVNLVAGTRDAIINMTRVTGADHESALDLTNAELEARRQIGKAIPYLKEHWRGFEHAYLTAIAPKIGIREARRIQGVYTLTRQDVIEARKFPDAVAVGCYPLDSHGPGSQAVDFTPIGGDGIHTIPYRCLIPATRGGVIAAGKCISADDGAFAAIRVIPTVMAIGEAAGAAAALSIGKGVLPHDLEPAVIRAKLRQGEKDCPIPPNEVR